MSPQTCILPSTYLGPVQYYSKLIHYNEAWIEYYEHFQKQTYRNRCTIYSPNGILALSVPLEKWSDKSLTKNIRIAYGHNWQSLHWRSIEAAYRNSPYFEFYEHEFAPFYEIHKFEYLIDLNEAMLGLVLKLLKVDPVLKYTASYQKEMDSHVKDFRDSISPKKPYLLDKEFQCERYSQTFESKHGFIPNLSIIDLLFNHGPLSIQILQNSWYRI